MLEHGSATWPPTLRIARLWVVAALFCVAYVLVDAATYTFPSLTRAPAPWNPQAALAVVLIALGGLRFAPAVVVAVFASSWLVQDRLALSATSTLAAIAIAAAYCGGGWLLRRFTNWVEHEVTRRDMALFVLIAAATAVAAAALYSFAHTLSGAFDIVGLPVLSLQVVVGEMLGLVVIVPVLLLLARGAWRDTEAHPGDRWVITRHLLIFTLVIAAILAFIFIVRPFDRFRMFYLLFIPMIVIAVRHGLLGTVLAVPIVQVGLVTALWLVAVQVATAIEFQLLMLTLAMTGYFLGVLATERRRAAARLAMHERELREQRLSLSDAQRTASTSELAAAVAHDLNQPLSAIGTYARAAHLLASRPEIDRETLLKTLAQISSESSRAGQYVRRMRDFFRSGTMHSEIVSVRELVASAHTHVNDRLMRAGIRWDDDIPGNLPNLRVDAVQVGAVLDNLLGNACDALHDAPGRRLIRVSARRLAQSPRPMVRIFVQDTGPGVAPDVRDQLFKPLATSKPHGMGLGLALSRSIAERLGGNLSFDAEKSITTFCLDLPANENTH